MERSIFQTGKRLEMDETDFVNLPEGLISSVLSLTSPRDTCRSSTISSMFRLAAESDIVWERFLPRDYQEILSRSVSPVPFSSKKELYFRLCDSILIDGGTKSFSLDKATGKICYMLCARDLNITWGNDDRYWRWMGLLGSRFPEVASLKMVWWLEIHGAIDPRMLSPRTNYIAYLIIGFDDNWHVSRPAQVSVNVGSHVSSSVAFLCPERNQVPQWSGIDNQEVRIPRERNDGWMEIELGDFFNINGDDGEVRMSLREVNCNYVKQGLIIQGIELRPRE